MKTSRSSLRVRFALFWRRHRTLLWSLHSVWALATGVVVIWLARERYGFVPWVVGFLIATWASTLILGRGTTGLETEGAPPSPPGLGVEVTSYLTRTLYQETLFFLIPFYAYSTVVRSENVVFLIILGSLALLSCLDMVFDRILREHPGIATIFFASVVFAAVNLVLPLVLNVGPTLALRLAALAAVASAVPLVLRSGVGGRGGLASVGLVALAILGVAFFRPALVPAVPLRLDSAIFAPDIDRNTLEPTRELVDGVSPAEVGDRLAVLLRVFAPGDLPTNIQLDWYRDGELVRSTREIAITAHSDGFRVWDGVPFDGAPIEPGEWRVVLHTTAGGIFGVATLDVGGGTDR